MLSRYLPLNLRVALSRLRFAPALLPLCILLGGGAAVTATAQDMRFTQYNALPTSLNPGYVGVTERAQLASLYRSQWSSLPNGFVGWHVAHDWYNRNLNSGFGVLFSNEQAGAGALATTKVALQYAYEVPLVNGWRFRPALQLAGANRSIDMSKLTFGDQLIRGDEFATLEGPMNESRNYADFGTGMLLVGPKMWVGFSADHINRPDESLFSGYADPMGVKTSTHGGFRMRAAQHPRSRHRSDFVFSFNYMTQDGFDQLDLGAYYDAHPLSVGLWWRGLPVGHTVEGGHDVDAVCLILGYGTDDWKIGYSYDITVSTLGLGNSGGSHELMLKYRWDHDRRSRPQLSRALPCPSF